jgi:phosphatidylinositol glycan class B
MPPIRKQQSNSTWSEANVIYFLLAFRICNALLIRTFFQPDEYFQSLEPAWNIAFGPSSGAWITWVRLTHDKSEKKVVNIMNQEWRERLRSSLHPFLFAAVYRVTALVALYLNLEAATRAELLLAAPKILQACFAASTDYFIWKLATKAYGKGSKAASAAVGLALPS